MLGPLAVEARRFACALGDRPSPPEGLLVVGDPDFEPWHFTAHLAEQAARVGRPDLRPTLLRWRVPDGARPHLSVSAEDGLARATRMHTVLVVDPIGGSTALLERIDDARRHGSRIMTIHRGSAGLLELSHETLDVDPRRPGQVFDVAQHVVTDTAGATGRGAGAP